MGVDHGRIQIFVAQKILDGADIISGLKQVRGKRVAKSVNARRLGDVRLFQSGFHGPLQYLLADMMTTDDAASRVDRKFTGREYILPCPFSAGIGIFSFQGFRQINSTMPIGKVPVMYRFHLFQVGFKGG